MLTFLCIVATIVFLLGLCVSGAVKRQEDDKFINERRGQIRQWMNKKEPL